MELTERRNLRGGQSSWIVDDQNTVDTDDLPSSEVEIAIIGAGIMGAMLADRLTGDGRSVVLLDRRPPAHGSTAASTALVMWAADVPLTHLARDIGTVEAARRWRRVHHAVRNLATKIDSSGIDCARKDCPELYFAGTLLDEAALAAEGEARRSAGLPSDFIAAEEVAARFGVVARPALLSADSYEVDPVKLTLELLDRARGRGARACFPFDAIRIEQQGDRHIVHGDGHRRLCAQTVILASGYERAQWFLPAAFKVGSSYAIATPPGRAPLWRNGAMIWEASSPYLYTRATADGRVIAGGEDEDFSDGQRRDELIGEKAGTIQAKLATMLVTPNVELDCAWAAAFGSSPDGLPAIGRAANADNVWLASSFGGNGVSFAALAAELIGAALAGVPDPHAVCFDPYRFD